MNNPQNEIDSIAILRQTVENSIKNSSAEAELGVSKLEILKLINDIENERLELKKQYKELLENQLYVQNSNSEIRQSETVLQHERELYQDLVNTQPAGIYRIRVFPTEKWSADAWKSSKNPPYCMELASDRFCELLGITRQDFEANPAIISDLIHPQDIEEFTLKNEEANTKIISFSWEGRLLIKDEIVWIHLESIPRCIADGEVIWTGILYDITSQKQDEQALKESENKYRELVDNSPDAIVILSEGNIVFVNNECLRLINVSCAEELLGRPAVEFVHTNSQLFANERMAMAGNAGEVLPLAEDKYTRCDGSVIDVEMKSMPIMFQNKAAIQIIVRDITERRKVERELNESREDFKELFDNAPAGYHEIDVDGRIVRMNETELNMLGYAPDEIIGKYIWEIAHNKIETKHQVIDKLHGQNISMTSFETTLVSKSGLIYSILILDRILQDENGNITGIRSTIQDITERNNADKALRESEEKYRYLFANNPQPMYIFDSETLFFVEVNDAVIHHYGYSKEEFLQMTIKDIRPKEDIQKLLKDINDDRRSLKPAGEWRHVKKNGEIIYVSITTFSIKLNGRDSWHVMVEDITERKRAEEALRISEEKFRSITEQISDYISISDTNGIIQYASPASKSMFQYEPNELVGQNFMNYVDEESLSLALASFRTGIDQRIKAMNLELKLKRKDGSTFFAELNAGVVIYENENRVLVVIHDITERKKALKALQESEDKYRTMIENSNDLIWALDRDGNFTFMNNKGLCTTGLVYDDWIGKSFVPLVFSEDMPMLMDVLGRSLGGENCNYELKFKKSDESTLIISVNTSPVFNGGEIVGVVSFGRDITKEKLTLQALSESEELYRNLVQRIPDGVYKSTKEGKFVDVNTAMIRMLGYDSKEEMLELDIKSQLYFDLGDRESIVLKELHEETGVFRLKKKDGTGIWIEDHGWYNVDDNGNILFHEGILRDITERKLSEVKLKEKMEQLLRFHNLTVDRELMMIELKKEINSMLVISGQPEKYKIV